MRTGPTRKGRMAMNRRRMAARGKSLALAGMMVLASVTVVPANARVQPSAGASAIPGVILKLNPVVVHPGGKVRMRLENLGAESVSYGNPFTLERYEKGRWLRLPSQGPFFAPMHGLSPGKVGDWQVVEIDKSDPPGLYRVQKRIRWRGTRKAAIRAEFRVRPWGGWSWSGLPRTDLA